MVTPTADDFRHELAQRFADATSAGLTSLTINAGELHRDLGGYPTFLELFGRLRATVLAAFDHQDYPFALLVEQLQPQRDPSRSPLFQTMFVVQKAQLLHEQGLAGAQQRRLAVA